MSKQHNAALVKLAILKAFETSVPQASEMFGIDEEDLVEYQREFLEQQDKVLNPAPVETGPKEMGLWERIHSSYQYEIAFKFAITILLMGVFWAMPFMLERLLDPLTNTIVWTGFTASYLLAFGSLSIEFLFLVMHRVNFQFFNRFEEKGKYDYVSFIKGNNLSDYQKCVLNQQKYLAYLALFCLLVWGLLNQMHPATN